MPSPQAVAQLYTSIVQAHKRLPLDAQKRLDAGETITMYSGSASAWTSKLDMHLVNNHLVVHMHINEALSARMVAQLRAQQQAFAQQLSELQ